MLPANIEEEYLKRKMRVYGELKDVLVDQCLNQAVIIFTLVEYATAAFKQFKSRSRLHSLCIL